MLSTPKTIWPIFFAATIAVCFFSNAKAEHLTQPGNHTQKKTTHTKNRLNFFKNHTQNPGNVKRNPATASSSTQSSTKYFNQDDAHQVKAYLHQLSTLKSLGDNSTLTLTKMTESLTARHYHFQQHVEDIPIMHGAAVVSIHKASNQIIRTFENIYPTTQTFKFSETIQTLENTASKNLIISESDATKLSIHHTNAKKTTHVTLNLKWFFQGEQRRLIYEASLSEAEPVGSWRLLIDAKTGTIFKANKTNTPYHGTHPMKKQAQKSHSTALNGLTAFVPNHTTTLTTPNTPSQEHQDTTFEPENFISMDGRALVFDPDPRTHLLNLELFDDSPAEMFEDAYSQQILPDLAFDGEVFWLHGPWVSIQDFEAPHTPPSHTTDGDWNTKRGNNAFNDAMSYYHIDKSQRYLQNLGFNNLLNFPIIVDSDGALGANNAYFDPSQKRIAFGHGCVDTNEDADVILHEYGHAIHFEINNSWYGGDTGAMGEGFGDYWAASYSTSTTHGLFSHPERMGSWAGHGSGDKAQCFAGRRLDQTHLRYNPERDYLAHRTVDGVLGDELWSTPLFQSLMELMNQGYTRESVDTIIIEAQFGLGANLTMPEMAAAIVHTAQLLYPTEAHATVFLKHFSSMNILSPITLEAFHIQKSGNGYIDPGESIRVTVPFNSNAQALLTHISSGSVTHIQTDASVTLAAIEATDDLGTHATSTHSQLHFDIDLEHTFPCGENIDFSVNASHQLSSMPSSENTQPIQKRYDFSIPTGQRQETERHSTPSMAIPDHENQSLSETLLIEDAFDVANLQLALDIQHSYAGDLNIDLISPSGQKARILSADLSRSDENIRGIFPINFESETPLEIFRGENAQGEWQLVINDAFAMDTGILNTWGLTFISDASCNIPAPKITHERSDTITIHAGESLLLSSKVEYFGSDISIAWEDDTNTLAELATLETTIIQQAKTPTPVADTHIANSEMAAIDERTVFNESTAINDSTVVNTAVIETILTLPDNVGSQTLNLILQVNDSADNRVTAPITVEVVAVANTAHTSQEKAAQQRSETDENPHNVEYFANPTDNAAPDDTTLTEVQTGGGSFSLIGLFLLLITAALQRRRRVHTKILSSYT